MLGFLYVFCRCSWKSRSVQKGPSSLHIVCQQMQSCFYLAVNQPHLLFQIYKNAERLLLNALCFFCVFCVVFVCLFVFFYAQINHWKTGLSAILRLSFSVGIWLDYHLLQSSEKWYLLCGEVRLLSFIKEIFPLSSHLLQDCKDNMKFGSISKSISLFSV